MTKNKRNANQPRQTKPASRQPISDDEDRRPVGRFPVKNPEPRQRSRSPRFQEALSEAPVPRQGRQTGTVPGSPTKTLMTHTERGRSPRPQSRAPSPEPGVDSPRGRHGMEPDINHDIQVGNAILENESRKSSNTSREHRCPSGSPIPDSQASTPVNDSRDPNPESPCRNKRSRSKPKSKSRPVSVEQSEDERADSPIEQSPSRTRKMAMDIKNHYDNAELAKRFVPTQQSDRGPRRVHDMWWAWAFVLIFLGYLGVSGWVNYQAFLIKDQAAEGPVDRCVGSSHLVQE
jgi:hypothetical protein